MTEELRYIGYTSSDLEREKCYTATITIEDSKYRVQVNGKQDTFYMNTRDFSDAWEAVGFKRPLPHVLKYLNVDTALPLLKLEAFNIPIKKENIPEGNVPFLPYTLQSILNRYASAYNDFLISIQKIHPDYTDEEMDQDARAMFGHVGGLPFIIQEYLSGHVTKAMNLFNKAMDWLDWQNLSSLTIIPKGESFYRARKSSNKKLPKEELFHLSFENRHKASTGRFSFPGFPSLYLGDSALVCWEEYDRHDINEMHFSKFQTRHAIRVFKIQRLEDFLLDLEQTEIPDKPMRLMAYLLLFPLMISCSMQTREANALFKPEYIIPQMLLRYVIQNPRIDGIMYPSTKLDYEKKQDSDSYNYIFPVRSLAPKGYCAGLAHMFELTEPISLQSEEVKSQGNYNDSEFSKLELIQRVLSTKDFKKITDIDIYVIFGIRTHDLNPEHVK
jgi:hypothetical protein